MLNFSYYLFVIILLVLLITGAKSQPQIDSIRFTNDTYTGYISENIGQTPTLHNNNEQSKRHNQKIDSNKKSIYIRFIDELKPGIQFLTLKQDECLTFDFKSLNLTLRTNDYDQDSISLFEIDYDNFLCTKTIKHCLCFFQIRVTDDPLIRDRINREAKDSYQFSLCLGNLTQSNVNVNILDDNDLEPMFDPSEYLIELNQFDHELNTINLPEFSVIGRVSAMDPDIAENSKINYYSHPNPYLGVNSKTGEIYLKKSVRSLFNLNEINFEVKSIDSGLKLNMINQLLKLNQTCFDNLNEVDEFNHRLVQVGSSLDQKKILQITNNLKQVTNFESAQVKLVFNRNLKTVFQARYGYPLVEKSPKNLTRIFTFNNRRLPLRVLNFKSKRFNLIEKLKIEPESPNKFIFEALNQNQILVSLKLDLDLTQVKNESVKYTVTFCEENECLNLVEFDINFVQDIIDSLDLICSFDIENLDGQEFKINKMTSLGSVLFQPRPVYGPSSFCKSIFIDNPMFEIESSTNNNYFKYDRGIVLTRYPQGSKIYQIDFYLNLKLNESKIKIGSKRLNFKVSYSNSFDFIEPSTQIVYFKETNIFDTEFLYSSVRLKNGTFETDVSHKQMSQGFKQDYTEAFLVLKQNLSRVLIVNGFLNDKIVVSISNKKTVSQKLLGTFTHPIENISIETQDPNDSKCFQIEQGQLVLKCKLPQSLNPRKKYALNPQNVTRHIDLYSTGRRLLTTIEIEFQILEQVKKIEDLSVEIKPIRINFVNSGDVTQHLKNIKVNKNIQNLISELSQPQVSYVKVVYLNESLVKLDYSIKSRRDCEFNKVIGRLADTSSKNHLTLFSLLEDNIFIIDTLSGELKFKTDFEPSSWLSVHKFMLKINITETNFLVFNSRLIDLEVNLKPEFSDYSDLTPVPRLVRQNYQLQVDKLKLDKSKDLLLIKNFDTKPSLHQFNTSYSIRAQNDLPFYLDSMGRLFYFNTQTVSMNEYNFQINVKFKFYLNDKFQHEETIDVNVKILDHVKPTPIEIQEHFDTTLQFDMSVPVHSSDFQVLVKTPLIGFISLTDSQIQKYSFDLNPATFYFQRPVVKRTRFLNSTESSESSLINENFLSLIQVDEQTGAVYFNPDQVNSVDLFSKVSKLINYFYHQKNMTSKLVSMDVQVKNSFNLLNLKVNVNLLFYSKREDLVIPKTPVGLDHVNNFRVNSDNLLNIFRNGDEFVLNLEVEENSPTWPAYLEFNQADQEGFIVNLKEYFKTRLNTDKKNSLINLNVLKNTRFYLLNDPYFQINDNLNGLVQTKYSIQFDYEIERCYLTKILVVQYLDSEAKSNDRLENDLVFESKHQPTHFSYFLDLNIRVANLIDEPFITNEPVYFVSVDENEAKNKKLLTVKLLDYDQNTLPNEGRFKSQILSGNPQGLFYMNGLSLYTSSSTRKLDRETRAVHELEVKIIENAQEVNSTRYALCRILITVNDINDNRPIVNDIELDLYEKLDPQLVNKIPVANAIAIDQDSIAKLSYSIVSVKILDESTSKRSITEDSEETKPVQTGPNNLSSYFSLNSTTGALFSTKPDMPCQSCSIQILYKANDIGRLKTRTSRKSYIKLNVLPRPEHGNDKTFELLFESNVMSLTLNEDVKLGEKVYQVKTKILIESQKSIVYYNLIEETNLNSTFYMSNHDGSLYLIKPLDVEFGIKFFNLSVLITNWHGQNEYVFIQVDVKDTNDNRPEFTSNSISLNETIRLESNTETSIDLIEAYDLDEIDRNKLTFKLEDCFYISHNLLIKKPYIPSIGVNPSTNLMNYPLCSKEFIEIVTSINSNTSQLIRLKINLNEFKNYLENSSDLFIGNKNRGSVLFIMDLSVKDSSQLSPSVTRVRLNLTLERESSLVFKRQVLDNEEQTIKNKPDYRFKRDDYFVILKSKDQLVKGTKLIRLFNEFIEQTHSFKPFDLNFYLIKNPRNLFIIDEFGLLVLNKSIQYEDEFLYEVEVGCRPKKLKVQATTKVLVSVLKSTKTESELTPPPVLSMFKLEGFVTENSPIGSFVKSSNGSELKIFDVLDLNREFYTIKFSNEFFDFDSGLIKVKYEFDHEFIKEYLVNFEICELNEARCFDFNLELKVNVINQNDNEPKLTKLTPETVSLSPSDLLHSMTLFKFKADDLDSNSNKIQIFQVKTHFPKNCSNFTELGTDAFEIFKTLNKTYGLKLTDLGYQVLIYMTSKKNCNLSIEIIVQASDGLFTNFINFNLTLEDHVASIFDIKSNPIVPILHTIETTEGIVQQSQMLDLQLVLENFVKTRKYSDNTHLNFNLLNYEDLFYINETSQFLHIRPLSELDRETRDTYELFITIDSIRNLPQKIRVLIKVSDVNDNRPVFVTPPEVQLTRQVLESFDLYEYNQTYLIDQLLASNKTNPLLRIQVIDHDLDNSVAFTNLTSSHDIFTIDSMSGSIFYNKNKITIPSQVSLTITARDKGTPSQESSLKINLKLLNSTQGVYFKTNFYAFEIGQNFEINKTIGYVNSADFYVPIKSRLVYSILNGDQYQQFKLDPLSGRLSLRSHFEDNFSFDLIIEAKSEFDDDLKNQVRVKVMVKKAQNKIEFDRFEYSIQVDENTSKMSEIFKLNVSDPKANFKLLNNLDLFYVNEYTGSVFNKQVFDFESEPKEYHLKIKAYNLNHQIYCLLVVRVKNLNDNRPEFDKSLNFAQIEIDENSSTRPVGEILLENSISTSNSTHQFVTKLTANDLDSDPIVYKIVTQTLVIDVPDYKNQLIESKLFEIESTGLVLINARKFLQFKKLFKFLNQNLDSETFNFVLKISASDSKFSTQTQLNVQVRTFEIVRPQFKTDLFEVKLDLEKYVSNSKIIDLNDLLKDEFVNRGELKVYQDGFNIDSGVLKMDKNKVKNMTLIRVPVFVCDKVQTGLCDQTIILLNLTGVTVQIDETVTTGPVTAFISNYAVYTTQQQFMTSTDYQYVESVNEDEYYTDEESNDANERFYYELKAYDLPEYLKYEFDIVSCDFQLLNLTIVNSTLLKQLKQFTQSKQFLRLPLNQVKQLFLLNKHNGVLSSRKIINFMTPGVFNFNISLKVLSKNEHNETVSSPIMDMIKLRLVILPAVTSLKFEVNKNDFKFEKEFYKFKFNKSNSTLGFVRVKQSKGLNPNIDCKLIDNKFGLINRVFQFEDSELSVRTPVYIDSIKPYLNEDNEILLNILCTVQTEHASIELMKELVIDFSNFVNNQAQVVQVLENKNSIELPKIVHPLRIYQNLPQGTSIFKIMALSDMVLNIESQFVVLDRNTGVLKVQNPILNDFKLNVSACKNNECVFTELNFELIKTNTRPPRFEFETQNGTIREDALPGTVITTLNVRDEDEGSKIEFYILNGDPLNQFSISNDGKVYTRLMLDREKSSEYSLSIIAFDGRLKSILKLNIKVLNVEDSRPICNDNLVKLELYESFKTGQTIFKINASNPENENELKYELSTGYFDDQIEQVPFSVNEQTGVVYLNDNLDYETKNFYTFYVSVSLNKLTNLKEKCLIKFDVKVLDVNDNPPEFKIHSDVVYVLENTPKGSILNVSYDTTDPDSLKNSIIHYSILGDSVFKIDQTSGLIQVKTEDLDRESLGNEIPVVIKASNPDNLTSVFNLTVVLTDLNDNKPRFERDEYFITIQENLPLNFFITEIKALDVDLNPNTEYYINQSVNFYIDKFNGRVYLNHSIDYEKEKQFVLEITAVDTEMNVLDNKSTTRLIIDVIDLNDNPPLFDPLTPKEISINENTPIDTSVLVLKAYDWDHSDQNNQISFRLINGSDYFGIDQTGRLYVTKVFDYESIDRKDFNILIECSDNGEQETLKSVHELTIHIKDLNDNEPVFARKNQTIILKDTFPMGDKITRFQVSDRDSFGQVFTLSIMEQFKKMEDSSIQFGEPIFSINQNNSLILIKRPLSNQTYGLKVRCYDSGLPSPLYSDSYLTVIITDESNTEPRINDTKIEIVVIDNFVSVNQNQVIGQLKAVDVDKGDVILYELNSPEVEVNQLNGLLRSKIELTHSKVIHLNPKVTDKKFIVDSELSINVKNVKKECLHNSLYAKFNLWHLDEIFDLEKFIRSGYLIKIKDHLQRLTIMNGKLSFNLSIEIIGLRVDSAKSQEIFDFDESLENYKTSLIEVLFIVKKYNFNSGRIECVNSKYMSKVLNKKKPILVKKLKMESELRLKLNDLSYNQECSNGYLGQVCSTNLELQTCRLKFSGYNQHDLCDSTNTCHMLPSYDWSCESINKNQDEPKIGQACKKNPCKNNGLCKLVRSNSKKSNTTRNRIHCFCPNGFKGKFCEQDVNECEENELDSYQWVNPCHQSANCINTEGSYICNCSLEPSSLCYNTMSPQYTATVAAFKNGKSVKNLKYSNSFRAFTYDDEDSMDEDESYEDHYEQVTLFGYHIPNHVIQQALLGVFGGICAILVLLSLAAGIVCKINFSRGYLETIDIRHDAMTSNTSVDHDGFTSSISSPGSFKIEKPVCKYKAGRFNRNKQRSSMTASLISSNTIESNGDNDGAQRKKFRYRINNLFFSKNEKLRGLQEVNKEESEIESSSAYSPKSEIKYNLEIREETNSLLKHENDADDEGCVKNGLIRPVDQFDTFGRSSFKTKYNTLDSKRTNVESEMKKFKFNTAVKRPGKKDPVKQCTTFLPKLPAHLQEDDKDSIATNEDSCLGFYWDITDWAGNLEQHKNDESKHDTYEPVHTHSQSMSPLYSRVFKHNRKQFDETTDDQPTFQEDNFQDDSLDVNLISEKLKTFKTDNYMYLTRDDCDKTLESIRTETNYSQQLNNDDFETTSSHYFTPFNFKADF